MNPRLQRLLSEGESRRVEFKTARKALSRSLYETVCAFLNRDGGDILLGVADHGEVQGVDPDRVFRFVLPISVGAEPSEKTSEKVSEKTSEKILEAMRQNGDITIAELAERIGITARSIERNIQKLQDKGRLHRIGPDKGGHWEVL